jgi:spoIIIJ-associated protein
MARKDRLEEVEQLVAELIARAHLDLTPSARSDAGAVVIELSGADESLLLDHRADLLESVQFLFGKVLQRQFGAETRYVMDCRGFRLEREREITGLAQRTAERVRASRAPIELHPMNPLERRIVHLALKDDRSVRTESAGEGFMKRVTIHPGRET